MRVGIDIESQGFKEEEGFRSVHKIRSFDKPTLIIHAVRDHIVPFWKDRPCMMLAG
jgi:fermentation-respiration switch protein FrsA (DUF1100 family)